MATKSVDIETPNQISFFLNIAGFPEYVRKLNKNGIKTLKQFYEKGKKKSLVSKHWKSDNIMKLLSKSWKRDPILGSTLFIRRDHISSAPIYGRSARHKPAPYFGYAGAAIGQDKFGNKFPHSLIENYPEGWKLLHAFFWILEHYHEGLGLQLETDYFGYPEAGLNFWKEWDREYIPKVVDLILPTLVRNIGDIGDSPLDDVLDYSGFRKYNKL